MLDSGKVVNRSGQDLRAKPIIDLLKKAGAKE